MTEIPKVLVLKPITPSAESAQADSLEYLNLAPAVEQHKPYEYARMNKFWDAEEGSLEEEEAGRQLAMQYMLMGSLALQNAGTSKNKELWSSRYTQATSELYGLPNQKIAKELYVSRIESTNTAEVLNDAAEAVREYIGSKYGPVLDALTLDESIDFIDPATIAEKFEAALVVLGDEFDEDWKGWTVERNDEKDSLSVVPGSKKILVGMQRAKMPAKQLPSLFSHEVLIHAQRGLSGAKLSAELSTGLPGYLDVEEGLGVFVEYALSGKVSEKNIDRYVDIAYALGMIDGEPHTRQELLDITLERARKRNDITENKKSAEDIQKEVYAHVNRIYRGSLGNEHIGIFTKDIAYHKGFLEASRYIGEQLQNGKTINEIMEYLLQGKFDPTNEAHVKFLLSVGGKKV